MQTCRGDVHGKYEKTTKETMTQEEIMQKATVGCSFLANDIVAQPAIPEEMRSRMAFSVIIKKTSELGLTADSQAALLSEIVESVIIPHKLEQKCGECGKNGKTGINPKKKNDGTEGMYA